MKLTSFVCLVLLITTLSCSSQEDKEPIVKVLVDIGDSLTAGAGGEGTTMSSVTSELLGTEWVVKNMGVGGENTLTIGARYGSIPMYIKESIIIPGDGTKVEIPSGLYSTYNDINVLPFVQGSAGINPCFIEDIECELSRAGGKYYINRININTTDFVTKPKSNIITALSTQKEGIATIFIGQNGGFDTPLELLDQINLFTEHKGDENVIVITSHGNSSTEIVRVIKERYGNKFIDLKAYMSQTAIYDAIEFDLLPNNGVYPTEEDLNAMENNNAPPTLLMDGIHFNAIGYELLGRLRFKKGQELGYW